jgi:hypothetical protein
MIGLEGPSITFEQAKEESWQKGETSIEKGSSEIYTMIQSGKGALIGRHGTIELTAYLQSMKGSISQDTSCILETNAGIFPKDSAMNWVKEYSKATAQADILALAWYAPLALSEWKLVSIINDSVIKIPLRSLEPYYSKTSWLRALEGQKVTVVSSFAETMKKQIEHINHVWPNGFPSATWSFVRSYYSPALAQGVCEWPSHIHSWSDALDYLEEEVLKTTPKVVLLGCGGLAMPLGLRLKKKGIVAIVMGGAIQILFGIFGQRWRNHPVISKLRNDDWVYPDEDEVPKGASSVEGGCYW